MTTRQATDIDSPPGHAGGEAGPHDPLPPARLLLVDDRNENLIALAAVLEPLGQEVVLARSGPEALKHLLGEDFALILLDVQMPGMDGFETATLIKQREKSRHIPIIFVTAINTESRYAFQGYESGAVDYLSKPIDADILRNKVRVFVELHQQARLVRWQAEALREAERREEARRREEAERERERQYTAALAEREAQLRQFKATLDATMDGVFLYEPDGLRFTYVNEGASLLVGYSVEELLAMTAADIAAEGEAEVRRVTAPLRDPRRHGATGAARDARTYETQCRHRDGRLVPVETRTQYVAPEGGGPARFVAIVRDISERKRAEAEMLRLYEREKRIAEALQQSIVFAPPEDLFPGLTIATRYQAAWDEANVGGDYLDVFALERGRVALIVGDVSGKGLAAAARTAEVKYALRAFLRESPDPARAFTRLNGLLCETKRLDAEEFETASGNFICVSVAVVDCETGEASVAVAGAEPPLLIHQSGAEAEMVEAGGPPLGVAPAATYSARQTRIEKGDMLLLLTDGITEARRGREFFGYEGFEETARAAAATGNVHHVGKQILEAARDFAGGKLSDDVCLLVAGRS